MSCKSCTLEPFFKDNRALQRLYIQILNSLETPSTPLTPETEQLRDFVRRQYNDIDRHMQGLAGELGSDSPFYTSGHANLGAVQFPENTWSKRLSASLKQFLPSDLKDKVAYTAQSATEFGNKHSLATGFVSSSSIINLYPFRGASNIRIKNRPLIIDSGADDDTSGEECIVEVGKQADKISDPIPDKVGELLAAMHIALVQKVLRMFSRRTEKAA